MRSLALRLAGVVALVVLVPLFAIWPFGQTHQPTVEIHDQAHVLQTDSTARELERLRFRKEVRLAVVTLDVGYNANFNSAVLAYAREHEPSWVEGNYWADGMVILAVSPTGRWVGCYFGEDVKVGTSLQQAIQDAGKDSFRVGRWAPGVKQMAEYSAQAIGRPIGDSASVTLFSWLGVLGGLSWLGWMLWSAGSASRLFSSAARHYTQVTSDYEATEIKAGLIPTDDAHGAQVLARFGWFEDNYSRLTKDFTDFGPPHGAGWFASGVRARAKALEASARDLDSMDDAISNTAALLTLSHGWQEAWSNEQGPLQEDLASFKALCEKVDKGSKVDTSEERDWISGQLDRLAQMGDQLASKKLTPQAALNELDSISSSLGARADALAKRALKASSATQGQPMERYKKSRREAGSTMYSGAWTYDGHTSHYDPAATIRINPSSPGATASGVRWTGPGTASQFSAPVAGLVTGYDSAVSWAQSSSGGSGFSGSGFSGGGFSGGSFSGAGSSSHF